MWDLIVSVPDHCLSFYFLQHILRGNKKFLVLNTGSHVNGRVKMFYCHFVKRLALQNTNSTDLQSLIMELWSLI